MEINNKGGKRVGAGRKPTSNPKQLVNLYVPRFDIIKFGGQDKLKTHLYQSIHDFTKPTYQIEPITDIKPITNTVLSVSPQKQVEAPKNGSKTYAQYVQAKRECELPEQWEELEAEIDRDPFLNDKQKKALKIV